MAKWVMMKDQVCRLMNNKYEDECNGVSIDNYVGIIVFMIVLVHLRMVLMLLLLLWL